MTYGTIHLSYKNAPWYIRWTAWLRRKTYRLLLPQNWTEVAPDKLEKVFDKLSQREHLGSVEAELLLTVVDVPPRLLMKLGPGQVSERLLPFLSWMLSEPLLEPTLTKVPFGGIYHDLPLPYFKEKTVRWYRRCEEALEELKASPAEANLDQFIVQFLDVCNAKTSGISSGYAYLCLFYYMSTREWMFNEYLPADTTKTPEQPPAKFDWDEVYIDIAQRGPFGPLHRVDDIPLVSFFAWMGKNHREYIEQQKRALQETIRSVHQKYLA